MLLLLGACAACPYTLSADFIMHSSCLKSADTHHLVRLNAAEVQDVSDEHKQRLPTAADGVHEVPLVGASRYQCNECELQTQTKLP